MRIANNEEDIIPAEKWLVSFRRNGKPFIRQFRAEGYYEAYDTVLTHALPLWNLVYWLPVDVHGFHPDRSQQYLA